MLRAAEENLFGNIDGVPGQKDNSTRHICKGVSRCAELQGF